MKIDLRWLSGEGKIPAIDLYRRALEISRVRARELARRRRQPKR